MKKLILLLLCAVSSFSLATTQASDGVICVTVSSGFIGRCLLILPGLSF